MKRKCLFVCVMFLLWLPACSETVNTGDGVNWVSYDAGMSAGEQQEKKIFISFYADWCAYCAKMEKETFREPAIVAFLNENFVSIRVNTEKESEIARKYFVHSLPMTWFMAPDGEKISSLPGYFPPEMFIRVLKFIHSDSYNNMTFQEYVENLENN